MVYEKPLYLPLERGTSILTIATSVNDLEIGKATRPLKHIQRDSQEMDKADVSESAGTWESAN